MGELERFMSTFELFICYFMSKSLLLTHSLSAIVIVIMFILLVFSLLIDYSLGNLNSN